LREGPGASPARDWRWNAGAAAVVALAALLRFHQLGVQELWLDEAFSFHLAVSDDLGQLLRQEYNPPLYYALQRAWVQLFGTSEAGLRSLSALLGTLCVAVIAWSGRRFLDASTGLWSGAFAALAPLHVYYSQEARPYALLTLGVALLALSLWRALETGHPRAWALFAAWVCLALSAHYLALLAVVATAPLVLLWPGGVPVARRALHYGAACALGLTPVVAWLVWSFALHSHTEGAHDWIAAQWRALPPALAIPRSLEVLALGSQAGLVPGFVKQFTHLEFPAGLRWGALAVLGVLGAWALAPWRDAGLGVAWLGRRKVWLCGLLGIPLALLWAGSFYRPYYVAARYDLVAFPAYALLVGLAFAKLQRSGRAGPALAAGAALVFFGALATKNLLYFQAPPASLGPSSRSTARALDTFVGDGDLVLLGARRGAMVSYYLSQRGYRRENGSCARPGSDRAFACLLVAPNSASLLFDFDHPDRFTWSGPRVRDDLRSAIAGLDPARNTVWVEESPDPSPHAARITRIIGAELRRAGFRPAGPAAPLERLGILPWRGG
jgi:4-amino-4-deoxy-L-arabinose transferase-like glycosyltransferase